MKVRTRFAPSPTGFLHVGGVRTALFNYLYAKRNRGSFILRLEDTDRERFVPEGVAQIVEGLDWLGLKPDEGFWISEGERRGVEFVQSERHARGYYRKYAEQLVTAGLAYYSPTTPSQLEKLRQKAAAAKQPFLYRKQLDPHNSSTPLEGTPIRLDVEAFFATLKPEETYHHFKWLAGTKAWSVGWEEPTGRQIAAWNQRTIDDFIIVKADGFPTYNFANVIDDHEMRISHVLRGDEFVSSTPKHIVLYHALGFTGTMPTFVHLPVINGSDGKKLSKRTGDTNVLDYRDKGYLPQTLINFLALLGWNDGSEQEIFSLEELVNKFSLKRINTSPAVFDHKRLDWMSGHYIRELALEDLYQYAAGFWPKEAAKASDTYKKAVLALVQERLKFLGELPELTRFFFTDLPLNRQLIAAHKHLGKLSPAELKRLLQASRQALEQSDFSLGDLNKCLNDLLDKTRTKPVVLFSLIRIAVTQAPASPGLADTLAVLGKETSLRRLDQQFTML